MSRYNELTVLSSRATDVLLRPDGSVITVTEGGPMLFIEKALNDAGVTYESHEGENMRVEIEVHDDGEYGRIPPASTKRHLGELSVRQWCIVSTLLDEWIIDGTIPEHLMVDIQGYVRDGSAFGKKQPWPIDDDITRKIYCLKGTEEEVSHLPAHIVNEQKQDRLLVVTHGHEGANVFYKGEVYPIPVQVIDELPDTVGAGDTFFAYFASALYNEHSPQDAASYASEKTTQFLMRKKTKRQ